MAVAGRWVEAGARRLHLVDLNGAFEGKHYQLAETINSPQALRRPRPRILIGGVGEKKTLRSVARHADIWNAQLELSQAPHKLDVLRAHCADRPAS